MPETPSASSTARRMELTVESRLTMEPLRKPFDSAAPSARNFTCSSASSAMRTQVLVLPMSRPTRYLYFFDNTQFLGIRKIDFAHLIGRVRMGHIDGANKFLIVGHAFLAFSARYAVGKTGNDRKTQIIAMLAIKNYSEFVNE